MNKSLPIVYLVNPAVAATGAFVASRNAARMLANSARFVLILPQKTSLSPHELQDFWRVEHLPLVTLSKNIRSLLYYLPMLFYSTWRLKKMMQKDRANRVQLNDFYLMHGAVLRLFRFKGHIVSWVRCDPVKFLGPFTRPTLWLARMTANRMVAVSAFTRSLLPSQFSVDLIYDSYGGKRRIPKIWQEAEEKTFVYIGNYILGKGQDIAIRAFIKAAERDATIRLAFFGSDMGLEKNRSYYAQLQTMVQQSGFGSRIYFGKFVAETYPILETAYAVLNLSLSESFSMTVLEASGVGVPVIATACGGPQEIIKEGVTGYLIPVGDVAAAADRILALAQNPHLAATLGQAAAEHVHHSFSESTFRTQVQTVLNI
jgi:glycosyltransferase involved in cell wall biosynthesis